MRKLVILLVLITLTLQVSAQSTKALEGEWVLKKGAFGDVKDRIDSMGWYCAFTFLKEGKCRVFLCKETDSSATDALLLLTASYFIDRKGKICLYYIDIDGSPGDRQCRWTFTLKKGELHRESGLRAIYTKVK